MPDTSLQKPSALAISQVSRALRLIPTPFRTRPSRPVSVVHLTCIRTDINPLSGLDP